MIVTVNLYSQIPWQSDILYYHTDNSLIYVSDNEGNRIPDFSFAGYKGGLEPIPEISVVKTLEWTEGDNTDRIMTALSEVYSMAKDENGFHGALLLGPGKWEIRNELKINHSGIVLRGSGDGNDPLNNTILWARGNSPNWPTVLTAGGGYRSDWKDEVTGSKCNITSEIIFVGDHLFTVEDASGFSIGDNIIIYHPCTKKWLKAIDYGGTHTGEVGYEPGIDVPWTLNSQPLIFNRYITDIHDNCIHIDAPIYNTLDRSLSQSYIYKYNREDLKTDIGIEDLRIDIEYTDEYDEEHANNAIDLYLIEDSWVKNCTMEHFSLSGIRTCTASRITIENCQALDPKSIIEGGKRYNFNTYHASQLILFNNCHASNGRHHYVSNGTSTTSGIVFLNCTSSRAYTKSEGHRRWSQGLLYDKLIELDGPRPDGDQCLLGLYNRGYSGTSHGWAAAHSVAWNCDVANANIIIQKPPTAQNYAIGCFGNHITGNLPIAYFDEPEGYIEGSNKFFLYTLSPSSLYLAQLNSRRLGNTPPPKIFVYNDTIDFGKIELGDTLLRKIKIENKGIETLEIENIDFNSIENIPFWTDFRGASLEFKESTTINIYCCFKLSHSNNQTELLKIHSNDQNDRSKYITISATKRNYIEIPKDIETIQGGIDSSSNGDTIIVNPGTYFENISIDSKNIVLCSKYIINDEDSLIDQTIIDGGGEAINNGTVQILYVDTTCKIIGFTIQNGFSDKGGGIRCINASPTLSNLTIKNNRSSIYGGGLYLYRSNAIINSVIIKNNYCINEGGGIFSTCSSPKFANLQIIGNEVCNGKGGGISLSAKSSPTLLYTLIAGNKAAFGGGIACKDISVHPILNQCTITNNVGEGILCTGASLLHIKNTIIWNNSKLSIAGDINTSNKVVYCDIDGGWTGENIIDLDPLFCSPRNGIYTLRLNSPCIGAGENGANLGAFDIGCEEVSIKEDSISPAITFLLQNYPNPFNPITAINFQLSEDSNVELSVFDMNGKKVASLINDNMTTGYHETSWDASKYSSGVYIYSLRAGDFVDTKKMVFMK